MLIISRMRWLLIAMTVAMGVITYDVASAEPDAKLRWQHEPGQLLALHGPQGIIWRLNFAKDQAKVFFDPLGTVDGRTLTWNAPPDHAWHYGLWFSWKTINGVNYWELDKTGEPEGITELQSVKTTHDDQDGANVVLTFRYHPANETKSVMNETVTLKIEPPRADGSYRIDWRQRSTAQVDVELNRTPPPGRPGGLGHGGYGGLSYRGARDLAEVVITDSQGRTDMEVHRQTARWLDASGTVDGEPAGVTIFDHPANPRHPTPWFIVQSQLNHGPFWYTNPALLCWEPMHLAAGETLELRYRILVHEGLVDQTKMDTEWKQFAALESGHASGEDNGDPVKDQ